ncbi:MAG: hypothetical protein F6K56_43510 [Moorea sp. SIO3G5]|nr:hypothetical protein [Moorena sp. SIO3G5]
MFVPCSLLPAPCSLFPVPCSLFPLLYNFDLFGCISFLLFDPVGGMGILLWNWHLASFLPGRTCGTGILPVSCRVAPVELASCQFPAGSQAMRRKMAGCC